MARTKRKINPILPEAEAPAPAQKKYRTAAYVRLSVVDSGKPGADTIEGQKNLLLHFIENDQSLTLYGLFCDNGRTGTDFERPEFEKLMEAVKHGEVDCIVVKDLSRFGRNYKETGNYLERIFPFLGVRFIAANDGFDTLTAERGADGYLVPLKNLINEVYSKDISKKSGSALATKQTNGDFIGAWAPYGYRKCVDDPHKLEPDEATASVVRQIFQWRAEGMSITRIAKKLNDSGIPSPSAYLYNTGVCKTEKYSIHGAQTNISYKNKKKVRKPPEEWLRVENTHEPIISKEVFEQVQEQIANRRRKIKSSGQTHIFSGLVKCADCGWSMSFGTNRSNSKPYSYFNCTSYRQHGPKHANCTAHYVRYDTLYYYVLSRIQYWSEQADISEDVLKSQLLHANDREQQRTTRARETELNRAEKRQKELDRLFAKLYEDWAAERITEYNFNALSGKYQTEQAELLPKIERIKAELAAEQQTTVDVSKWIDLIHQYAHPTELTAEMLNALIEKIVVHESVKGDDGDKEQEIEIFYRFVGRID